MNGDAAPSGGACVRRQPSGQTAERAGRLCSQLGCVLAPCSDFLVPAIWSVPLCPSTQIFFDLVDPADAMDPIGPPDGTAVPGGPAGVDPADALAMRYYCALNFNVGGSIKRNTTVERVAEDGPLSPGAYQCARECNKMGAACAAFGVVAGTNCYLMGSVRRRGERVRGMISLAVSASVVCVAAPLQARAASWRNVCGLVTTDTPLQPEPLAPRSTRQRAAPTWW